MGNMAGLKYEDVMPGKTDILAISVNKPYGDFAFIQIPVSGNLELQAYMPEDSKTIISSKGLVEVKEGRIQTSAILLTTDRT